MTSCNDVVTIIIPKKTTYENITVFDVLDAIILMYYVLEDEEHDSAIKTSFGGVSVLRYNIKSKTHSLCMHQGSKSRVPPVRACQIQWELARGGLERSTVGEVAFAMGPLGIAYH
eukprot:8448925-Ditylum_brightwellii.AAC.1